MFTWNAYKLLLAKKKLSKVEKSKANMSAYLQQSLSLEIIYTILNGVNQKLVDGNKTGKDKKSILVRFTQKEIDKMKKLADPLK